MRFASSWLSSGGTSLLSDHGLPMGTQSPRPPAHPGPRQRGHHTCSLNPAHAGAHAPARQRPPLPPKTPEPFGLSVLGGWPGQCPCSRGTPMGIVRTPTTARARLGNMLLFFKGVYYLVALPRG